MYDAPATGMLQQEYDDLISLVHPDSQNRMNALEYVHDVVGQNERKAVLPEEDITPPQSMEQGNDGISVSYDGSRESNYGTHQSLEAGPADLDAAPAFVGSTAESPPRRTTPDDEIEESGVFYFGSPTFSFSKSIHYAQLELDDAGFEWYLNV